MKANQENELIFRYLIKEKNQNPEVAIMAIENVIKYDDIREDFLRWLQERNYTNSPLIINDYTPEQIFKLAPFLDGIGIYNFMVTLRDHPEQAKQCIDEGFPVL